jgi:hypothetical protein
MSDAGGSELQFERMEAREASAPATCRACGRPLSDVYYEAGGSVFCGACREGALADFAQVSPAVRFLAALAFGAAAAALGAAAWFAIVTLTGYQIGLVAVVIGWAVGRAVLAGSGGRGGAVHQLLAVLLTYLAIAASYVPRVLPEFDDPLAALLFALELPVLQIRDGGILGALIVGFALYEAWRINQRRVLAFSGPFRLGSPAAAPRS